MSTDAATIPATPATLPDDVATLKALIGELLAALQKTQQRNAQLEHRLDQLLRRVYGQKSEQLDPAQLLLFLTEQSASSAEAAPETPPVEPASVETETITVTRKKGHGRRALPDNLPRVRHVHELTEAEQLCPCCHAPRTKIGEDISEQLEYVPASLFVIQHVHPKYACAKCRDGVATAAKPAQPIDKGLPGPGLLAHIAVSKYLDHLPLHRQERILTRHGVRLGRSTLCDWMQAVADLARPLVALMRAEILSSHVIQTDDTPVDVLDRDLGKRKTRTGRLWVYRGDAEQPHTVFDYTPNHTRAGPAAWLGEYRGSLQCDAYSGYDELFRTRRDLVEVGCWAHARRYFFESQDSDPVRARLALLTIGKLYEVERQAHAHDHQRAEQNLPADFAQRFALRQSTARPVLNEFHAQLETWQRDALPQSPLGKAVQYARHQWTALGRYVDDAALAIDNNAAERDLRAVAIGRKNWLFCGSDRGGHTAAVLFSLCATCQRHCVEPFAYLRDLLTRWPTLPRNAAGRPTAEALAALRPHVWQPITPAN
jgi:transposase